MAERMQTERVSLEEVSGDGRSVLFGESPRTVHLTLAADESVPPHRHPDTDVVFYLRSGRLDLRLDEETHRLTEGDILRFDGGREIAPTAVEASEALVFLVAESPD